ncbi:hypothetical protein ABID23_001505 [Bartonella silvatica]|uniref:Uncharacterized protein n=1 Tax=Bartonella silvatica TaxID=357760 RepID=A0ABV2HIK8_9HYPH
MEDTSLKVKSNFLKVFEEYSLIYTCVIVIYVEKRRVVIGISQITVFGGKLD